jgi:hypothetical protein
LLLLDLTGQCLQPDITTMLVELVLAVKLYVQYVVVVVVVAVGA